MTVKINSKLQINMGFNVETADFLKMKVMGRKRVFVVSTGKFDWFFVDLFWYII